MQTVQTISCERAKSPLRRRSTGRHLYQFYKAREDFFRMATGFLYAGLQNREACLWAVSLPMGVLDAFEAFRRRYEIDSFVENSQLLILPAEQWYLDRDRLSSRKLLARFKKFVEDRRRRGFQSFRFVGDLGWLEDHHWEPLQSCEEKLDTWIRPKNFTLICAYPIYRCSLGQTKEILDRHRNE